MRVQYHGKLANQEKSAWNQLVQAAQGDTLRTYINDHGYGQVFGVLEHLNQGDAQTFLNFLETQLQKETAAAGAEKRDSHHRYHDTLTRFHGDYCDDLSDEEKKTW